MYKTAVVTLSDKGNAGLREDLSGDKICGMLAPDLYEVACRVILPDVRDRIERELIRLCDEEGCDLILTTGGTGLSPRDVTPEATLAVGRREVPGIAGAIRAESMKYTGRAMFGRGVSVLRGHTLIVNLPGSPKAVEETLSFLLRELPHGLDILLCRTGECGNRPSNRTNRGDRVLIRGAGDLSSGIALRLHRCGFQILMTELENPTTVRRTVAFSRAVYEDSAVVEDAVAVFCRDLEEAEAAQKNGRIAVITDVEGKCVDAYRPDILIDVILAKKNLGTRITDAPVVIGVGPGFTAGVDCHCVIETKRGHDLGRCILKGSAAPNTGIPGSIGGYSSQRLLRAPGDGVFQGLVSIGDQVRAGQEVGRVGEKFMRASIDGVVRGLLQDGVEVKEGMKAGDVDPRADRSYCFTVSDKANAVAGGVLEAVLSLSARLRRPWES